MTSWRMVAKRAIGYGAQQKVNELAVFLKLLAGLRPKIVVEIGVAEGGTLWAWQRLAPTVIGVDIAPRVTAPTDALLITGDSHDESTAGAVEDALVWDPIDCLFLDGDHSYDGVARDYWRYAPLVRRGGLVAFHDIISVAPTPEEADQHGVAEFWGKTRDGTAREIIDSTPGSGGQWGDQWGGIGVLTR